MGSGGTLDPVSIPKVIPLFPLPNFVFFPRTYVPLHIFEPRYREMVQAAAASHRMVGMVLLREGWEADYAGAPAIFAMGCVGRMMNVQLLSDGRLNILLQGLRRFEIQHEVGAESYRQGRIVLRELSQPDAALPAEIRREAEASSRISRTARPDGANSLIARILPAGGNEKARLP